MTTWSNEQEPKQAEVWLAHLNFSDKPSIGKVRPILILDATLNAEKQFIVTSLKITSKNQIDSDVKMAIENWKACGLKKPSYVRLDQVFKISENKLLKGAPIGLMDVQDFSRIIGYFESTSF